MQESQLTLNSPTLGTKRALIVGMGGLGCPAALALARAGVGELILCDDDTIESSNLPRQILFSQADVGKDKLEVARLALLEAGAQKVSLIQARLLPATARKLVRNADVVVEGADNFATKFLAADACYLEKKPIVHGAGVRFHGTAWLVGSVGSPCYRCLFEDLPEPGHSPNCSEAGVLGPVVGIIGALMADLALDALHSDTSRQGRLYTFSGKAQLARSIEVIGRTGCPLCGTGDKSTAQHGRISDTLASTYLPDVRESPLSHSH